MAMTTESMKRNFTIPRPDRQKYNDPKGRFCGCGQPALKRKCGAFVCARCDAMEHKQSKKTPPTNPLIHQSIHPSPQ